MEPIKWEPDFSKMYIKAAETGTKFEDIDDLKGFVDLDEESGDQVLVDDWSYEIKNLK